MIAGRALIFDSPRISQKVCDYRFTALCAQDAPMSGRSGAV